MPSLAALSSFIPLWPQSSGIAGGTSLFAQLRDRLERDVAESAPQAAKVKVMLPVNVTERRFSVWIGKLSAQTT